MTKLDENLVARTSPVANAGNIITGKNYRITVLTPQLIRTEVSKTNEFCDEATQIVFYRDMPKVEFATELKHGKLYIKTKRCVFTFSESKKKIVKVTLDGVSLALSDKGNLGGTCRTLDMRAGKVDLGKGVISKTGLTILNDDGLIIRDDGSVGPRKKITDKYYFAYGHDYRGAIKAFYGLTGSVLMLPRYAFGNWWSRYRAYTQKEYLDLMDRFAAEDIPITVATVDMDWHWVDVNKRFNAKFPPASFMTGPGWTGYSWNTELFPDYREFLYALKARNLHTTLNLHPSDGVRFFETQYEEMALACGIDPRTKQTVKFDLSDNNFLNNYFKILHKPYEDEGVDFWWIDWQQGKKSSIDGLDPLWALNHYHYLDSAKNGKRGIILSRFAGAGSHRYPLGFSGDCISVWSSLKFQPHMTATAANIGYGWWSHDIGGHNFGVCDDELYLRWCQLGVFSPINRLHSSSHDLTGKEPWNRSETVRQITTDYLRLRHRLIPYIYSAMRRAVTVGRALCEPMYYEYPTESSAYKVKNEYFFGSELIVCPITERTDKRIRMAKTEIWVPDGRFTDVFTGKIYHGNKIITAYRDLEYLPVLAKEGAIIPLSCDEGNGCGNPEKMELLIYRGNNSYTLYEDDGISTDYKSGDYAETTFTVKEADGKLTFIVSEPVYGSAEGEFRLPERRSYKLRFKDIKGGTVYVNGMQTNSLTVVSGDVVEIVDYAVLTNGDEAARLNKAKVILSRYQARIITKKIKYFGMKKVTDCKAFMKKVKRRFGKNVYLAVKEVMEADLRVDGKK